MNYLLELFKNMFSLAFYVFIQEMTAIYEDDSDPIKSVSTNVDCIADLDEPIKKMRIENKFTYKRISIELEKLYDTEVSQRDVKSYVESHLPKLKMISTLKNANHAKNLISRNSAIGIPKPRLTKEERKNHYLIHSIGTLNTYKTEITRYLNWTTEHGIKAIDSKQHLRNFLEEMSEERVQTSLDKCRMAFRIAFRKRLKKTVSKLPTVRNARDYSFRELLEVLSAMTEKNAISAMIAFCSGLRAHEFCTIRPLEFGERSTTRTWRNDLFSGMSDHKIYLVTGKNGLVRYVAIPSKLSIALEQYRYPHPINVTDRGLHYQMYYDIGFGLNLSSSFSQASKKTLGKSNGIHGLRHSYAKNRMRQQADLNINYEDALTIVSQEMGHFRPEITKTYLRGDILINKLDQTFKQNNM